MNKARYGQRVNLGDTTSVIRRGEDGCWRYCPFLCFVSVIGVCLILGDVVSDRAFAGDVFVAHSGSHKWPYATWVDAATNIQEALLAASPGDNVVVTDGVYRVDTQIEITNGVMVRSVNGAQKTVVIGGYPAASNRCFYITHPEAVLDGFTVMNGWAVNAEGGGGIFCDGGGLVRGCTVLHNLASNGGGIRYRGLGGVTACVVASNTATSRGGGIMLASGVVEQSDISGNIAMYGGGVYCRGNGLVRSSNITGNYASVGAGGVLCEYGGLVLDSTISGNHSDDAGGGIGCSEGGMVRRCLITGNSALYAGGGCVLAGMWDSGMAENCVVSDNTAKIGGGVALSDAGSLQNCTVVANSATEIGGGIYCAWGGSVLNTVAYFNSATNAPNWFNDNTASNFVHSCTFPMPPGWGNLTNAPQFMNAASEDYHLTAGSPCIDRGTFIVSVTNDFDGIPRPLDGDNDGTPGWDIGAYEFVHPSADTDADRIPDAWEVSHALNPLADDAQADPDLDGMPNVGEYVSDTDPHDADSVLSLIRVGRQFGGIRLDWKGGREAWQILECRESLASTTEQWTAIFALPPPTALTNAVIDMGATNRVHFYRIRAER